MRISSEKLTPAVEKEVLSFFFQVMADTNKKEEIEQILKSLLSKAEIFSIAKRVAIAKYLTDGLSRIEIKKRLKISSASISQIQTRLEKDRGLKMALEKIGIEEWAASWEAKIKALFSQ